MTNLTISIDENLIRQARIRAISEGTSVSAQVREFLGRYARGQDETTAPPLPPLRVFEGGSGLAPGIAAGSNRALLDAADAHDA